MIIYEIESDVDLQEQIEVENPKKYQVILHNDNKTTFEFVIFILTNVFRKDLDTAMYVTQQVHEVGQGIAGIYTKEIAEEKVYECMQLAKLNHFPFTVTHEEY